MAFQKLNSINEYFNILGCKRNYSRQLIKCEICNSNEFEVICSHTDTGNNILAPVEVQACKKCGFLMQNPRFEKEFYEKYYEEFYPFMRARSQSNKPGDPTNVGKKTQMDNEGNPNEFGYEIAIERANNFYNYLNKIKLKITNKKLLDVGCGCGGFLELFKRKGYVVKGNDPDIKSANFAIKKGLKVDVIQGEKMEYKEKFGLIIIIGSLEHCHNPNTILKKCWEYLDEDGIIVLEGRYYPISESFRWLNSNHHRFLTDKSAQAILVKHGFEIILSTTDPVSGENTGRNGGGFAFAKKNSNAKRYLDIDDQKKLIAKLKELELIQNIPSLREMLKKHDEKFDINFS
ncbi:class I SAM-dependent methyltransferase [Prochlorococcus marinus]|uniref:class I SAM-dependent methyltransferase n=1 Tax=Prochlorococcus marinus TaxID=1219 RepID=UPI001ADB8741|nr:class I SAM-dependent methyltransferase [Prochlorococcus marinus]MBO8204956.1 class I SAM-dependent methyltransferase [Prochlorococcus marinus CUG1415]MBW3044228.1 hypothetical protein [Prochlorococcus marinus str. MU1415]